MFTGAESFNQPLNTQEVTVNGNTYKAWDVSNVKDMAYMFEGATSFNQPLNNWNVSKVSFMRDMFLRANSMEEKNKPNL